MCARIRIGFCLAALLSAILSISAFAKGGFDFITITGANLKKEVYVTDPALTTDFFAFADFSRDGTETPANPGAGYEITRYYMDGNHSIAFDQLHYFPETGFVFYDGIANGGWSEYDGKWYTARTEMKAAFESVVSRQLKSLEPVVQQSVPVAEQNKTNAPVLPPQSLTLLVGLVSLAALVTFAFWFRKL